MFYFALYCCSVIVCEVSNDESLCMRIITNYWIKQLSFSTLSSQVSTSVWSNYCSSVCSLHVCCFVCVYAVCLVVRTGFWVLGSVLQHCHLQLGIDQLCTPTRPPPPTNRPPPPESHPIPGCISQTNRRLPVSTFLSRVWRSQAYSVRGAQRTLRPTYSKLTLKLAKATACTDTTRHIEEFVK